MVKNLWKLNYTNIFGTSSPNRSLNNAWKKMAQNNWSSFPAAFLADHPSITSIKHKFIFVFVCVYVCVYVCMCVQVRVCVCVCVYVCVCVWVKVREVRASQKI